MAAWSLRQCLLCAVFAALALGAAADHYRTLELSSRASSDEVRRSYKRLAKEHHPDKVGGGPHLRGKAGSGGDACLPAPWPSPASSLCTACLSSFI